VAQGRLATLHAKRYHKLSQLCYSVRNVRLLSIRFVGFWAELP